MPAVSSTSQEKLEELASTQETITSFCPVTYGVAVTSASPQPQGRMTQFSEAKKQIFET